MVVVEDDPLCSADMYFEMAANKACIRSLLEVSVLEVEDADAEDDTSGGVPGGAPGGGPWFAMADTNCLSVRLPVPLVSSLLHICVA